MGQCLCKNIEIKNKKLIEKGLENEKQKINKLTDENNKLKKQIENKNKQIKLLKTEYDKRKNLTNETYELELTNNYKIKYREKDDYINIINIFYTNDKKYINWFDDKHTKLFLEKLKMTYEIELKDILKYEKDENDSVQLWVHPLIAINISQWISDESYFLINKWIFENINKKNYKNTLETIKSEILEENKILKNRIKLLENKVLQKQPRENFDENKNVVYVVTTEYKKIQGHYKIGKAQDLQKRLSTYNTTDKHEVIFNTSCKTKRKMDLLEQIVHDRLDSKRIEQNREWFLSEDEAKDFIKIIKECKSIIDV